MIEFGINDSNLISQFGVTWNNTVKLEKTIIKTIHVRSKLSKNTTFVTGSCINLRYMTWTIQQNFSVSFFVLIFLSLIRYCKINSTISNCFLKGVPHCMKKTTRQWIFQCRVVVLRERVPDCKQDDTTNVTLSAIDFHLRNLRYHRGKSTQTWSNS